MQILLIAMLAATGTQDARWKASWAEALKDAKANQKLALLVFTNKGLKDCQKFEADTLGNDGVALALGKFVCAKVDPDGTDDENKLWQDHKMPRPPMSYIYDPEGKRLAAINSLNAKVFSSILNAAGPAYFEKIGPAREALAKDPAQADKLVMLAEAYANLDNPAESAALYEKATDLLIKKGDTAGALKIIEGQLAGFYKAKWYLEARGCCRKLAELDPGNTTKLRPLAAWINGMADCKDAKWNDAIMGMKSACEQYKDAPMLDQMLFTLGSAYMYNRDKDNAIAIFERIIKDFPDSETARIAETQASKLKK